MDANAILVAAEIGKEIQNAAFWDSNENVRDFAVHVIKQICSDPSKIQIMFAAHARKLEKMREKKKLKYSTDPDYRAAVIKESNKRTELRRLDPEFRAREVDLQRQRRQRKRAAVLLAGI